MKAAPQPPAPLRSPPALPIRLGREPAVRLIHVPDAHYVLHMALPCVCDRAITAQRGLWDLTPPTTTTTDPDTFYSI